MGFLRTWFGRLLIIIVIILISFGIYLSAETEPLNSAIADIEASGFSGVILVQRGDKILAQHASGFSSCDESELNTMETAFSIGSVTKMFTAISIGQLDEAGILDIDAPISTYWDNIPPDKMAITVRQLLTHRSGLHTYHDSNNLGDFDVIDDAEAFERIMAQDLLFEPGTQENYSNSGSTLLAMLIENVTGQSYTEYVREHIFEPANMINSGFWGDAFSPIAHTRNEILGCSSPDDWEYSWVLVGNGGIVSTANDLNNFLDALANRVILSDEAIERLDMQISMTVGFTNAGGSSQHDLKAEMSYFPWINTRIIVLTNAMTSQETLEQQRERIIRTVLRQILLPHRRN